MKVTMRVFTGSTPVVAEPDRITVEESEGLHDMVTLFFSGDYGRNLVKQFNLGDVAANDIGPPASIEVITGSALLQFYGYIDTTVENRNRGEATIEVYFLSASSIMRNGTPRVWHDKLPFDIAKDILQPYGIGLEMDKIPHLMESFTQSDESDWEAMRNLAVRNGLSLTASGTILRMRDVVNETRRAKGADLTPWFRRPGTKQTNRGLEASQFTQVASRTPVGGERYRYYGIDHLGVAFDVTGGVSSISKNPGVVVGSLGSALREARRHETTGRFVTRATLESVGHVGCSSGSCVIVDNEQEPEYWYVTTSTHTLVPMKEEHHMKLELCRQDGLTPGYISATIPARPATVLIGKEWRCDRDWKVEL